MSNFSLWRETFLYYIGQQINLPSVSKGDALSISQACMRDSLENVVCIIGTLYLLTKISLPFGRCQLAYYFLLFWVGLLLITHLNEIMCYVSFLAWLILLDIMTLTFIHTVTNVKISFVRIEIYIYISSFPYSLLHQWTFKLFIYLGYYE